ncbi:MAG: SDR family NAD(P)-dependent oxidoreductase [Ignavibacteriales bacterium]|nr:SDR family NAD(P)-dependent oxidoreductase [Ignavibacteriales bacterium]
MKDKTILITGSTDGIGRQAALELAALGATVLVHGRDARRGENVVEEIRSATGNKNVELFIADFSSMANVRQLAAEVKQRHAVLHTLVNNAGVFMNEKRLTAEGFETTFAVNHLAPFLLTNLLLDLLKKSAPARVVTVSSVAHTRGKLDFDNLQAEKSFGGYSSYALSKLANVLFTYGLADALAGTGVTSNCLHPGVIGTKLLRTGFNITGASTADGAETLLYLVTSPEVDGVTGKYFQERQESPSSPVTHDAPLRARLWEISARLTGL